MPAECRRKYADKKRQVVPTTLKQSISTVAPGTAKKLKLRCGESVFRW